MMGSRFLPTRSELYRFMRLFDQAAEQAGFLLDFRGGFLGFICFVLGFCLHPIFKRFSGFFGALLLVCELALAEFLRRVGGHISLQLWAESCRMAPGIQAPSRLRSKNLSSRPRIA